MLRGKSEVETCRLNGWGVGTVLRGHESWGGGSGTWTTMVITGLGETTVLGRGILSERTRNGAIVSTEKRTDGEHPWTLQARDWTKVEPLDDDDPEARPAVAELGSGCAA